MARQLIFVVGLVLAAAFNLAEGSIDALESNIKVTIVSDIDQFLNENPGLKAQPLIKQTQTAGAEQYVRLLYRIGSRISGDRLLATAAKSQSYPSPRNINLNLSYPSSGIGGVISYFEIAVDQTSNTGRAYVVSGGIGKRQISVVVEAKNTLVFSYRSSIYGY